MNLSDKTISILFAIDGLSFGGGERVFLQLVSGLRDHYRVSVATEPDGRFAYELDKMGIKIFSVNMSRRLSFRPILQMRDIIKQKKITMVHSQGARADFFARVAGRITGVPHILSTVAMPVEGFDVSPLRKQFYRFMDRLSEHYVNRFIVVSNSLARTLIEERRITPSRVVKIYNGIELDAYCPDKRQPDLRNRWGVAKEAPLIGAIGRLVWQKGFEYFIRAIPEILRHSLGARFLLVGDGPLRPELEKLSRNLNAHQTIIFTGFRSDIKEILSSIDVLVAPSLLEGFPMITLEAMAMAKPIVATQINGIIEQISNGIEGILVPPKDSIALATEISRLIQNRKYATKLGAAARRKVENFFSVGKMVRDTAKVYEDLLRGI